MTVDFNLSDSEGSGFLLGDKNDAFLYEIGKVGDADDPMRLILMNF